MASHTTSLQGHNQLSIVNSPMFCVQVVSDAAAAEAPADTVREGGDTPAARRGTFLDLALCLAGGLHDMGLATLFKTAALGLPVGALLVSSSVAWCPFDHLAGPNTTHFAVWRQALLRDPTWLIE